MNVRENVGKKPMNSKFRVRARVWLLLLLIPITAAGFYGYDKYYNSVEAQEERVAQKLLFDQTISRDEQVMIRKAIVVQSRLPEEFASIAASISTTQQSTASLLGVYVPVTAFGSVLQTTKLEELATSEFYFSTSIDEVVQAQIINQLKVSPDKVKRSSNLVEELPEESVAFIPIDELSNKLKLLSLDDKYYLDTFNAGAVFRSATFSGSGATKLEGLELATFKNKDSIYKVNMTGVTALTRVMQRKLDSVKDPLYFSKYIGDFLSDADLTHISNEVSFKAGCTYHATLFCSDPRFIETLKASGVDLVELTGNHNNDVGSEYNTQTINQYHQLGWATIGGGLNTVEAAKPYYADTKGSKVAFLAYNYPDSPNGGAIAGTNKAGANSFDFDRIATDIAAAKAQNQFVIVDVQYWECYAYPNGFIEFPECDKPIGKQEEHFKKIIDLGADMVIGSSAHQPQTYELYNGKPIYYGLGNLYFEQTSWPGTERGIILTHYFSEGKLLQTKLTPTVYDKDLQTRVMTEAEANYLLTRLKTAR